MLRNFMAISFYFTWRCLSGRPALAEREKLVLLMRRMNYRKIDTG